MRTKLFLLAMCLVMAVPASSAAQQTGTAKTRQPDSAAPCCSIVAIDVKTMTVTARETASGYTFKFKITDKKLLESLKVAEKIWADFTTKTIRLKKFDAAPCCNILPAQPGDANQPQPTVR
jgi:hypothetical protein